MFAGQYFKSRYFQARFWDGDVSDGAVSYREVCRNSVIKGRGVTFGRSVALGQCYFKIAIPWFADELVATGNQTIAHSSLLVGVGFGGAYINLRVVGSSLVVPATFGAAVVALEQTGIDYWTIEDTFVIELGEGVGEWAVGSTFEVQ